MRFAVLRVRNSVFLYDQSVVESLIRKLCVEKVLRHLEGMRNGRRCESAFACPRLARVSRDELRILLLHNPTFDGSEVNMCPS